jgi:4-amino-4-deoxy-L-arabinose transferase-like glycosyltransferase
MNQRKKVKTGIQHTAYIGQVPADKKPKPYSLYPIYYTVIFILAAVPFAFGKYFELNSPDPYDSAAYVYSAQHIFSGAKLGVEETPSAQPGTLLVNMLGVKLFGFSELGPKLIQGLLQAVALVLMFYTMRKLYGTLAAALGVIIASLYLSAPLIAKFGNVKEQHMIAFMVIGVCCYVLRYLGGKWWLAVIAGAALGWAPMFKQTGVSAIAAVGLFVILSPLFKWRSFKQTAVDIGLLAVGFIVGIAPVCLWILANHYPGYLPYLWAWNMVFGSGSTGSKVGSYVSAAREVVNFKQQFPQVMRYYGCLILPIALALSSVFFWTVKQILNIKYKISNIKSQQVAPVYEKFVLLFGIWWILDMAFVWISPRGYEQYYLPLNASAAMAGGYLVALYCYRVVRSNYYPGWVLAWVAGLIVMFAMSLNIVIGITVSPFSGKPYGERSRGFVQKWEEVRDIKTGKYNYSWAVVGDYIHEHSKPDDGMFVWGWFPGIYIRAERFCPSPAAFESSMHTKAPQTLAADMNNLLVAFNKKKPVFIVDSRKNEFPNDRLPLPLWPTEIKSDGDFQLVQGTDEQIAQYDESYAQALSKQFKDGEGDRYRAMKPMRDFIRHNYKIVNKYGQFVLFELKDRS